MKKIVAIFLSVIIILCAFPISAFAMMVHEEYYDNGFWYIIIDGEAYISEFSQTSGDMIIPQTLGGYLVAGINDTTLSGCYFSSITIPPTLREIRDVFNVGIKDVYISDIAAWCNMEFGGPQSNPMFYAENLYLNNKVITKLTIPEGVTKIPDCAFKNCDSLYSITLPSTLESIGWNAFENCTSLTKITIPDKVTLIDCYAFRNCTSLSSVTFGAGLKKIESEAFYNCNQLKKIVLPEALEIIGIYAFENCSGLQNITIPKSVTDIKYSAFQGCTGLLNVYIEDIDAWCDIAFKSLYSNPMCYAKDLYLNGDVVTDVVIKDGKTEIGAFTFAGLNTLESITIPESVKKIGQDAFASCLGLKEVHISSVRAWLDIEFASKDSDPVVYGMNVYIGNELLKTLVIPEGTEIIEKNVFANWRSVETVKFPKSLVLIKQYAFYGCKNLKTLEYEGTKAEWDEITALMGNEILVDENINVTLEKPILSGDFNGDDYINSFDIALMKNRVLKESKDITYDITGDGKIDVRDLVRIKRLAAGTAL